MLSTLHSLHHHRSNFKLPATEACLISVVRSYGRCQCQAQQVFFPNLTVRYLASFVESETTVCTKQMALLALKLQGQTAESNNHFRELTVTQCARQRSFDVHDE